MTDSLNQTPDLALDQATLNQKAKALWDACPTTKPSWDQLGDVTQGVWREKVLAGVTPADYLGPFPSKPVDSPLASLFASEPTSTLESQ